MKSIFFDLETSDREPIGQILNYCFTVLNENWDVLDELAGDIKLSRLQIPSPSAILANRIDIQNHQATAQLSERDALRAIAIFLEKHVLASKGPIALIGYNSFKFDIPYLRTSLIRNGINPYIGTGKLMYRDLFAAARKLSVSHPDFPRAPKDGANPTEDGPRLSLKLETIAQQLGVLRGKQAHDSRADVAITIAVARGFLEHFDLDVRTYEAYEATSCHQPNSRGRLFTMCEPQYNLSIDRIAESVPVTLLDFDRKYALWINLNRFAAGEGKRSIMFYKTQGSSFVLQSIPTPSPEQEQIAKRALEEFGKINLRNFFTPSICDIEQDIYRIDFDGINALHAAIWNNNKEGVKQIKNRDLTALYVRSVLAGHTWGTEGDDAIKSKLKQYAEYRYGGALQLSKFVDEGTDPKRHPTLNELVLETNTLLKSAQGEDRNLLLSLLRFIESSEINLALQIA